MIKKTINLTDISLFIVLLKMNFKKHSLSRVSSFKRLLIFTTKLPAEEKARSDSTLVGFIVIR